MERPPSFFSSVSDIEDIILIHKGDIFVPDNNSRRSSTKNPFIRFSGVRFPTKKLGSLDDLQSVYAQQYMNLFIEKTDLSLRDFSDELKDYYLVNKSLEIIIESIFPMLVSEVSGYKNMIKPSKMSEIPDSDELEEEFRNVENIEDIRGISSIQTDKINYTITSSESFKKANYLVTESVVFKLNKESYYEQHKRKHPIDIFDMKHASFYLTKADFDIKLFNEIKSSFKKNNKELKPKKTAYLLRAKREYLRRKLMNSDFHEYGLEFQQKNNYDTTSFISMPLPKFSLRIGFMPYYVPYNNMRIGMSLYVTEERLCSSMELQASFIGAHPFVNHPLNLKEYHPICMGSEERLSGDNDARIKQVVDQFKLAKNVMMYGFQSGNNLNPHMGGFVMPFISFYKLRPRVWCNIRGFKVTNN